MILDEGRDLVAAPPGRPDIGKDDVGPLGRQPLDRLLPVVDGDDLDVLGREHQLDDALDGGAAVGEQELVAHWLAPAPSPSGARVRARREMKSTISCIGAGKPDWLFTKSYWRMRIPGEPNSKPVMPTS